MLGEPLNDLFVGSNRADAQLYSSSKVAYRPHGNFDVLVIGDAHDKEIKNKPASGLNRCLALARSHCERMNKPWRVMKSNLP